MQATDAESLYDAIPSENPNLSDKRMYLGNYIGRTDAPAAHSFPVFRWTHEGG